MKSKESRLRARLNYQPTDTLLSLDFSSPKFLARYASVEKQLAQLVHGRNVLDVGACSGLLTLLSAKHGAVCATGIDSHSPNIDLARQATAQWIERAVIPPDVVKFVHGNIWRHTHLMHTHDVMLLVRTLYHVSKTHSPEELFKPMQRPGVTILIQCNEKHAKEHRPLAHMDNVSAVMTNLGFDIEPLPDMPEYMPAIVCRYR